MKKLIAILALTLISAHAVAQKRMYITDNNLVPLRTGQGLEYRIVNKGLPSGTQVEILEQNEDSGYTLVREPSGTEGWLPSRYLTSEPIARDRLAALQKEFDRFKADSDRALGDKKGIVEENQRLAAANEQLTQTSQQLQEELQHIKRISENAVALDQRNRELRESNQRLKNDVELLTAENMRLKENSDTHKMLVGAGLVSIGILIAILVPWLKPKKKSSWA